MRAPPRETLSTRPTESEIGRPRARLPQLHLEPQAPRRIEQLILRRHPDGEQDRGLALARDDGPERDGASARMPPEERPQLPGLVGLQQIRVYAQRHLARLLPPHLRKKLDVDGGDLWPRVLLVP